MIAQEPVVHEILVFADDNCLLAPRAVPNHRVIGRVETEIKNMRRSVALASDPPRQRRRKLRVNEKVHAGRKTAWSACRAA